MLKTVIDRFLLKWQDLGGHDVHLIITGHDGKKGLELVELELKTIFVHLGNTVKKTIWGESVWQKKYIRYNESVAEEDYLKIQ